MRVIGNLRELPEPRRASAVTIGNFDGVHLAHQKLLSRVVEIARSTGSVATAVTFEPHPTRILTPDNPAPLLTLLGRKVQLIERQGIDFLVVLPFTQELANLAPRDFVRSILVDKLRAAFVHVGSNFRFGHRQAGDTRVLVEMAQGEGFRVEILPILEVRCERVSSSRIRDLVREGRVHIAGRLLGRSFSLAGPIVSGLGVGRRHTVPTLNLAAVEEQRPQVGVYVTRTRLGDTAYDSVSNVGYKPTFGENPLTVESYLVGFAGEINASEMEIEFLYRLRDEKKFSSPALLRAQIQDDARRSLKFHRLLRLLQERNPARLIPSSRSLA